MSPFTPGKVFRMATSSSAKSGSPLNTVKGMADWLKSQSGYEGWSLEDAKDAFNKANNPKNATGKFFREKAYYVIFPDREPEPEPLKLSFAEALEQLHNAYNRKEPDLKGMSKDDLNSLLFKVTDALRSAK
jgi:hypothetical protein